MRKVEIGKKYDVIQQQGRVVNYDPIDATLRGIDDGYQPGLIQWIKQSKRWDDLLQLESEINRAVLTLDVRCLRSALEAYKTFFSKCSLLYTDAGFVIQGDLFETETGADAKPQIQVRTRSEERKTTMKISKMFPSNYFSKDDLEEPELVTIKRVDLETIRTEDGEKEKPVLYFEDGMKPMILNKINAETLSDSFGDDSDTWEGKEVELYVDPNIRFGSKKIGGIRVRVPNTSSVETPF